MRAMRIAILSAWLSAIAAAPALAEPPRVVADIAPVHALVARVMEGVGEPDLLLPPGASPHDFAFRPSDARRLSEADLVVWVGPELTPWLAEPLDRLAPDATRLTLIDTEGWPRRALTEVDHGDHAHAGEIDPHAWLDPQVAAVWVVAIARALAEADPDNANHYAANAAAARTELAALAEEVFATLPDAPRAYVYPHAAYGYFTARFGLPEGLDIAPSDGTDPGPVRLSDLRTALAGDTALCIFTDAEVGADYARVLAEGHPDTRIVELDPIGADLEPGAELYPALIRAMAGAFATCLAP